MLRSSNFLDFSTVTDVGTCHEVLTQMVAQVVGGGTAGCARLGANTEHTASHRTWALLLASLDGSARNLMDGNAMVGKGRV